MKMESIVRRLATAFLTVALALITGCESTGNQKGEAAADGLQVAANRIGQAQASREAVLTALNDLVEKPQADLRPQFKKFTTLLSQWEASVQDVQRKSASMQEKGAAYFQKWDEELAKIQNEDIRNRSLSRKSAVTERFAKIKTAYAKVDAARQPLMADLADIRTALSADLTRAGLEAVKPAVRKANLDAGSLGKAGDQLIEEFEALGLALSAVAPPAPK